jgi:hypothetical protein
MYARHANQSAQNALSVICVNFVAKLFWMARLAFNPLTNRTKV